MFAFNLSFSPFINFYFVVYNEILLKYLCPIMVLLQYSRQKYSIAKEICSRESYRIFKMMCFQGKEKKM